MDETAPAPCRIVFVDGMKGSTVPLTNILPALSDLCGNHVSLSIASHDTLLESVDIIVCCGSMDVRLSSTDRDEIARTVPESSIFFPVTWTILIRVCPPIELRDRVCAFIFKLGDAASVDMRGLVAMLVPAVVLSDSKLQVVSFSCRTVASSSTMMDASGRDFMSFVFSTNDVAKMAAFLQNQARAHCDDSVQ